MTPDQINGTFETLGALFVLNHCRKVWLDKRIAGVSVLSTAFFTAWGFWNLYYYPHLNQPFSFYGGLALVVANSLWVGMMAAIKINEAAGVNKITDGYMTVDPLDEVYRNIAKTMCPHIDPKIIVEDYKMTGYAVPKIEIGDRVTIITPDQRWWRRVLYWTLKKGKPKHKNNYLITQKASSARKVNKSNRSHPPGHKS